LITRCIIVPTCAFLSFRLGGTDGVSIVASTWMDAFRSLGFQVVTVAGDGPVDHLITGLGIDHAHASTEPDERALRDALAAADLVVVENLLTIPMNLSASRVVARVLRGRPALLHHHDPAWQRGRYQSINELPPDDPMWRHVTINRLTEHQLRQRGVEATTIYNAFDPSWPTGDRAPTRRSVDVDDGELLVVHPVRAIARKGIDVALSLTEHLDATYWLTGPPEEDFAPELDRLLATARCRVIHQPIGSLPDLYAAADLVAFPSSWEGFGNPPVEASLAKRPVAVGTYPVLDELTELGFRWLDACDPTAVRRWLARPDASQLTQNRSLAVRHFSTERLVRDLARLADEAGWTP
jgi:mannosylglucosylglycerate synthase